MCFYKTGTPLNSEDILLIKELGINRIQIVEPATQTQRQILHRFRKVDGEPLMFQLRQAFLELPLRQRRTSDRQSYLRKSGYRTGQSTHASGHSH